MRAIPGITLMSSSWQGWGFPRDRPPAPGQPYARLEGEQFRVQHEEGLPLALLVRSHSGAAKGVGDSYAVFTEGRVKTFARFKAFVPAPVTAARPAPGLPAR